MTAALVGLVLLSIGVVWLLDGGPTRWPAYLGRAALTVIPAALLIAWWQRLHMAAGHRVVNRTSWTDRDTPHYGWRIEAAVVGALLSLIAAGAGVGSVVSATEAYQRSSWNEVEAQYVRLEPDGAPTCTSTDCPDAHRILVDGTTAVFIDTPAKSWPSDDDLPATMVKIYYEGNEIGAPEPQSPAELVAVALVILFVGVPVAAGAWTVLSEAAYGPPRR
jgi:hypothetical protein